MHNARDRLMGQAPKDWRIRSVGEVAARIESGGTPSREIPAYWNGGIPWVTPGELTGEIDK